MKHIALLSLLFVVAIPLVTVAGDVNVNINAPPPPPPAQEAPSGPEPPPPLEFAGPPDVVVVPSGPADVYLVPGMAGLYFFGGSWYRFHRGYWFKAGLYSGPWVGIGEAFVPGPIAVIPPDYVLGMPAGYHRIHYGEFYGHWRDWGRTHYWNSHPWYRDHALHHWGGRSFVSPVVGHHGDIHGKPGIRPGGRGPGRSGGPREGVKSAHRGPGGVGPRVGVKRGSGPGGHGGVSHGGNIGRAGGKSVGGGHGGGHGGGV